MRMIPRIGEINRIAQPDHAGKNPPEGGGYLPGSGSRGSPSMRSPMMLSCTSVVPP